MAASLGPDLIVSADTVVTPAGLIRDGAVRVRGDAIVAIDSAAHLPDSAAGATRLHGAALLPGFIDLHWHGYGGLDPGGSADEVRAALRAVAASGVTTCYAGLGAGETLHGLIGTLAGAAAVTGARTGGARLAGIFLEGPYISVSKKGAWNAAWLRQPSVTELHALRDAAGGALRRINIAPELPGALPMIEAARAAGLAVSIGHSDATYDEAIAGIDAGATIINHTFNAMSGLDHRRPGLVGAALTDTRALAELILDHIHVHPAAARALLRARGAEGVALITDASPFAGMPDGQYERGGRTVRVGDGAVRLADGVLAGSATTMDRDVRHAALLTGHDLLQLAALSSGNAARVMGLAGRTGALVPGHAADLVLLDDALHVIATIVAGEVVYRAG